jgi:hypothetical protein
MSTDSQKQQQPDAGAVHAMQLHTQKNIGYGQQYYFLLFLCYQNLLNSVSALLLIKPANLSNQVNLNFKFCFLSRFLFKLYKY